MTARVPPAMAMWLLRHLGSGYRGESLAGDLFEEYQQGRSSLWYWQQTMAAILTGRARSLRVALSRLATRTLLRLLTEIAALVGVAIVAQQSRQICSLHALLSPTFIVTLIAVIALAVSIGFYLSLCFYPSRGRATPGRKPASNHRLMAAFTVMTLSVGTLTWASTASKAPCAAQACACQIAATAISGGPPGRTQQ